jgi:3-oxoacyl-[acyl-carrier-protein] synthase-3
VSTRKPTVVSDLIEPSVRDARAARFKSPRAAHDFRLRTCSITGLGSYVPERVLTNAELAKRLGTTEEWIFTRTGICERRIAGTDECASDMAAKAASRAMAKAGVTTGQIGLIVVATNTPDMLFPATACIVQSKLGIRHVPAFDLKAAGSAFIYALEVGQQFIASQSCDTVLVVGAEKLSAIVDWQDRDTSVLFGDGAGAAILQSLPGRQGLLTTCMGGQGDTAGLLFMPAGGSRQPASSDSVAARGHFLQMDGRETFKEAIHAMHSAALEALGRCQLSICDIDCIIPHQANQRIIDAVTGRLGARPEQSFTNLRKYGNTSGAAVAIALTEAVESGRVQRGDLVLLLAFGAGLTWAAAIIEW